MTNDLTALAVLAVERYGYFLDVLRSQAEIALMRGAGSVTYRTQATTVAQGAARTYVSAEAALMTADTLEVAHGSQHRALTELGLSPSASDKIALPERMTDFITESVGIMSHMVAAQAERDVSSMAQQIHHQAMRIDLYVRSGKYTRSSAVAAVAAEDGTRPTFQFVDRIGRKFKSTKHVRDAYRMHLINTANEVFIDTAADYGVEEVVIEHPDPNYKWQGVHLSLTGKHTAIPLYYDVRNEVFHPSSQARLTIGAR